MRRLLLVIALLGSLSILTATAAARTTTASSSKVHHGKVHHVATLKLIVKSDSEHGKKGPDGKWHDAFLPASFKVKAGVKTRVTVINYDNMPHSFVSPSLHLDVKVPAAKGSKLGRVTFTIRTRKVGRYDWWCSEPCDPWAMTHDGYMRGYVKVVR